VADGLLRKVPYREPGQRSRSEYRLTEKGLALFPLIVALLEWGNRRGQPGRAGGGTQAPRLRAPVQLQLCCADGRPVASAREVTPVPGPGARLIA
jgi:HxlR-like helix-turn-helix